MLFRCLVVLLALGGAAAAAPPAKRRHSVQWLMPYGNLTTVDQYVEIYSQLPAHFRANQSYYAASAYALKANNASLGYATTPAGEAYDGLQMEQLGLPAFRRLGLSSTLLGMVYVTHSAAIATMLADPSAFIAQLLAKAEEQQLAGFDIDYEPQGDAAGAAPASAASFMSFVARLAAGLAAKGRVLTIDISGCPQSFGFDCTGLSNLTRLPGLLQVNTEDAFNARSVADIKDLQRNDGTVAMLGGARWAPGFEPHGVGQQAFTDIVQYLASPAACSAGAPCPLGLSTWAWCEWNTGKQPEWLFDVIDAFLDAPVPPEVEEGAANHAAAAAAAATVAAGVAASTAAAAAAAFSAPPPPNFVFILSDDLGFGELSIAPRGAPVNTNISTPNIDALFRSGMQFSDAYCGEAVCAPSRNALMTGQHTGHTLIRGNAPGADGHGLPLRANDTTWLQLLQAQGYETYCVGKWGLGWVETTGAPNLKGCGTVFGGLDQAEVHDMYPFEPDWTWRFPAANGSRVWEGVPFPTNANASRSRCMAAGNDCVWIHDQWTQHALAAIAAEGAKRRALGEAARPFALYLAYTDPHAGGWNGEVEAGNPVPSDAGPVHNYSALGASWPPAERDHASVIANFQDASVGQVVAALEREGLRASTAVVFASDNGASNEGSHDYMFFTSSGPLRGFKRCLFEGGIRTQFAVSWPGTVPANSVSGRPIAFWDVLPTFAELAGVPAASLPAGIDGVSFAQELLGGAPPEAKPLYWEFCTGVHADGVKGGKGWGQAVRSGDMKIVRFFEADPFALYNLTADIGETTDLAAQHPDVVKRLAAVAAAAHVEDPNFPSGDAACSSS